ncbi:MAG: ATP-dependent helicase [Deltaproteobacteria bacterium]|nr:ATP-dependent helicase [Deltaproteobacteria bacterium]
MQDILDELNEEQKKAVNHGAGPLLVVAGAGTGKTKVITARIARLIASGVPAADILALTFTEKAAAEMEERVDRAVPYGYSSVWISTFHAFGERVLRDNALAIGITTDFKVLSEAETVIFLKERLFDLPMDYYRPLGDPSKYLSAIINSISRLKDEDVTPGEFSAFIERLQGETDASSKEAMDYLKEKTELSRTYEKYAEIMAKAGYLDFGDLITLVLKLFRQRPNILKRYGERFKYILADEFQDTNYAQFELLRLLGKGHENIMAVADDDQSIYKFRGAASSNVMKFREVFPGHQLITLKRNYRSVQSILDASYRLIRHNDPDRLEVQSGIDKRLISARPEAAGLNEAAGVKRMHFDTIEGEAGFVADTIFKKAAQGGQGGMNGARYKDFAVLVRARSDARPFLCALENLGLPCHFSGGSGLYAREDISLLISFLRCVTDFNDNLSLFHLASSFIYGLKAEDIIPLNNLSKRTHRPLIYIMKDAAGGRLGGHVSAEGAQIIRRITGDVERFSAMALEESAGRVLYNFLTDSGYIASLVKEGSARSVETVKNIARFFEVTAHMEERLLVKKAGALVELLRLFIEAGENPSAAEPGFDEDAVQVMTVHKAKGLEFSTVFMVNLVDRRFPRSEKKEPIELPDALIKDILPAGDFHLQEERRLFYVGMTRARDELFLTSAANCGGARAKKPSRFVAEALLPGVEPLRVDAPEAPAMKTNALDAIAAFGRAQAGQSVAQAQPAAQAAHCAEDGAVRLSFYQIDDYLTCPYKYRFAHVLKIPLLPHHNIIYGKAVHDAIAFYFRRRLDNMEASVDELLGVFNASWRSEGFLSKGHENERFSSGVETLRRFYAAGGEFTPVAVEKEFSIEAGVEPLQGESILKGRWDIIVNRGGEDFIMDFKTSDVRDAKKAAKKAKESLQLKLYTLAYKTAFQKFPAGCALYFVESGISGEAQFGQKEMDATLAVIAEVSEGVRKRAFNATPDYRNCSWCAFNNICSEKSNPLRGLSPLKGLKNATTLSQ